MFTSPLPDSEDYRIFFSDYAKRYYIKRFEKDYKGRRWDVTLDSIFQDLKRIHALQKGQQVDELNHGNGCKLFKYDFAIAQSGKSPKNSGNRCVALLDEKAHRIDILMVYGKGDIPKNMGETQFIRSTIKKSLPDIWERIGKD